jgi:hypothetical protein
VARPLGGDDDPPRRSHSAASAAAQRPRTLITPVRGLDVLDRDALHQRLVAIAIASSSRPITP